MTAKRDTIDHHAFEKLLAGAAFHNVTVLSQADGLSIVIHDGMQEKILVTSDGSARVFREYGVLADYLRDTGMRRQQIDAIQFSRSGDDPAQPREDAATPAEQSAAYEKWFCEQVEQGLAEADDPATQWVSNEEVNDLMAEQRTSFLKRVKASPA